MVVLASLGKAAGDTANGGENSADTVFHGEVEKDQDHHLHPPSKWLWGPGAGITLGSFPVFSMWENALPDSLGTFGLDNNYPLQYSDSSELIYRITQKVDPFSMSIPISINYGYWTENSLLSVAINFSTSSKRLQSSLFMQNDSLERRVNLNNTIRFTTLGFGAEVHRSIPRHYFSITGVDQTFFTAALGVSPFSRVTVHNYVSSVENDTIIESVRDSVVAKFSTIAGNGIGASWRLGISSVRKLDKRSNLLIGLCYSGSWFSRFRTENRHLRKEDINPQQSDELLSFVANRIEFTISLLYNLGPETTEIVPDNENLQ